MKIEEIKCIDDTLKILTDAHARADKELDLAYSAHTRGGSGADWDNALARVRRIEGMITSVREIRSYLLHCIL